MQEWWRDPRCHFGTLDDSSPLLTDQSDLQAAIAFILKNFESASSSENADGSVTDVQRSFDYVRSRINTTFRRSASRELLETWFHSWRAYTLAEVAGLLAHAGLDLVNAFGGWRSEAYGVDTRRMIVIGERRAAC